MPARSCQAGDVAQDPVTFDPWALWWQPPGPADDEPAFVSGDLRFACPLSPDFPRFQNFHDLTRCLTIAHLLGLCALPPTPLKQ